MHFGICVLYVCSSRFNSFCEIIRSWDNHPGKWKLVMMYFIKHLFTGMTVIYCYYDIYISIDNDNTHSCDANDEFILIVRVMRMINSRHTIPVCG